MIVPQRRAPHPQGYKTQPESLQDRLRNRLLVGKVGALSPETIWTTRAGSWRNCWVCWSPITPDEVEVISDGAPACHMSCVALWEMESLWYRAVCAIGRSAVGEAR